MTRQLFTLLAACLAATPCAAQEIDSVCLSLARPGVGTNAEIHHADGRTTTINTYDPPGLTVELYQQFETSLIPAVEPLVQTALAAAPEAAACTDAPAAALVVTFTDGSSERRDATCSGNAIEQFVNALILTVPPRGQALSAERVTHEELVEAATDACAHDWPVNG